MPGRPSLFAAALPLSVLYVGQAREIGVECPERGIVRPRRGVHDAVRHRQAMLNAEVGGGHGQRFRQFDDPPLSRGTVVSMPRRNPRSFRAG